MQTRTTAQVRSRRHRGPTARSAILACLALGACVAAAGALARPTTAAAASLRQDVDALVAGGAPGAILLVRDGDRKRHLTGGVANFATRRAMQPTDHYRIASLTKSYVATVVLQLVAEGKLRLSDDVERWLPGLVPKGDEITIRQLLNHTSGLYDHEKDQRSSSPT